MEPANERPQQHSYKWLAICIPVCVFTAIAGVFLWNLRKPSSLLPAVISRQAAVVFTPFFYEKQIPAGYSFDVKNITFDQGILLIPLTKPGGPTLTLTEQAMPAQLTEQSLLGKGGDQVKGALGSAAINMVEGRLVGSLVSQNHKTLILLTASSSTSKEDFVQLLQGLRPIR